VRFLLQDIPCPLSDSPTLLGLLCKTVHMRKLRAKPRFGVSKLQRHGVNGITLLSMNHVLLFQKLALRHQGRLQFSAPKTSGDFHIRGCHLLGLADSITNSIAKLPLQTGNLTLMFLLYGKNEVLQTVMYSRDELTNTPPRRGGRRRRSPGGDAKSFDRTYQGFHLITCSPGVELNTT
jgi:hypothetical protein